MCTNQGSRKSSVHCFCDASQRVDRSNVTFVIFSDTNAFMCMLMK